MKLGVTGGIASGKSTVIQLLHELGAVVVDSDAIARELTAPGTPLVTVIIDVFGSQYAMSGSDDALDRARLAHDVFQDPLLRKKLEALTLPPIIAELERRVQTIIADNPNATIAIETPLLFEAHMQAYFDKIMVVWCSLRFQRERLALRNPALTERELMERILSQISLEDKRAAADFVINSEKTLEDMRKDIAAVYAVLQLEG
jgi:dephospho-CoA kinase